MRNHVATALGVAVSLCLASSAAWAQSSAPKVWSQGMDNETGYSSFIVKYRDGTTKRTSAAAAKAGISARFGQQQRSKRSLAGGLAARLSYQRRLGVDADLLQADQELDRAEAEVLMRRIAEDPDVEYVQPNYLMRAFAAPNDPRYGEQWHYAAGAGGARLENAWDRSTGAGVVVAVVDSGILRNADLDPNILPGYDMVSSTRPFSDASCRGSQMLPGCGGSDDGNGRDADPLDASNVGHGTHVAGTVAAVTNNARGVAGVAFDARVVPVRVLGNQGVGGSADIIDGMLWGAGVAVPGVPANANPAEVVNLSLGGRRACSPAEQDAINRMVNRGTIVVVAAGNSNTDVSGFAPANCNNVVAVAANDRNGNRAIYSNYGQRIDITAPGGETWSCPDRGEFLPLDTTPTAAACGRVLEHPNQGVLSTLGNNTYGFDAGTSMAAPHVAGVVALIQSVSAVPRSTADIKDLLARTARAIPAAQCPGGCGPGILDADAAVREATR
ncbi:S8 family serine peptidase [Stenotrophomonas tumulicola]|nr:S8 family serine peptidase [Stenotrophomonas tumulicola]